MSKVFGFRLLRRNTGQIAGRSLSVNVLSVLVAAIKPRNQRDVLDEFGERFDRRSDLRFIYTRRALKTPLVFDLVGIEPADELGDVRVLFARKETASHDPVGQIDDGKFFRRLLQDCIFIIRPRQRRQPRERQRCSARM